MIPTRSEEPGLAGGSSDYAVHAPLILPDWSRAGASDALLGKARSGGAPGRNPEAVAKAASVLLAERVEKAIRQAHLKLRLARRARSRRQYAFWASVVKALEGARLHH